jgi:protein-arginine kinase activator protein McsA
MSKRGNQMATERARQYVFNYLSQNACIDCGESDVEVLTFDHIKGEKKADIASMISQGFSTQTIMLEIEKTEVVCYNCHMRREQKRRGYSRFGRFSVK